MPSPFQAAGAASDPSRSAPLHTNRFFTGLWTQRSPLRDAATTYLLEKYYSANRFDSMIGGNDSEVSPRLTLVRRPGQTVYNSVSLPPFRRLYPFRTTIAKNTILDANAGNNLVEQIHVVGDFGATVRDATGPSTNLTLYTKTVGNTANACFQSVGNKLFMVDGVSAKKWLLANQAWGAETYYTPGTIIIDTHNNIQQATIPTVGTITQAEIIPFSFTSGYFLQLTVATPVVALYGTMVSFTGLTGLTALNGTSLASLGFNPNTGLYDGNVYVTYGSAAYDAAETGTATSAQDTSRGITGPTQPTWPTGKTTTVDTGIVWQGRGTSIQNMGFAGPTLAPSLTTYVLPVLYPAWAASTAYAVGAQILDSNHNIQQCSVAGTSGGTVPTWPALNSTGASTTDGTVTWLAVGIYGAAQTAPVYYAWAYKNSAAGHVSTASPRSAASQSGANSAINVAAGYGSPAPDPQVDTVVIYRTTQGGSTLLELVEIPYVTGWNYNDDQPDNALNFLIQAAIADANDPPPAGITILDYHLGRLWGAVANVLSYSGGPDTLTGSGLEAWPPGNNFSYPSAVVRTWATSIGLIVFTTSDVYIVLGNGAAGTSFTSVIFQAGVGLLSYDAFAVNGSTCYFLTTAKRFVSWDPSAGETELGFPIGDILATYSTTGATVAYHEGSSADSAIYVADGTVGWYRLTAIAAPEQGFLWMPQAQIVGGCNAVASIEISPGVKKLLVALNANGPILMRDATVNTDNGATFPVNTQIGSIVLAQPGQLAGLDFITIDAELQGSRPTIGLRIGEIGGAFETLYNVRQDPPLLPPAATLMGWRYYMGQNQQTAWCRHMQINIGWPAEDAANELLTYTIFGQIKNEV